MLSVVILAAGIVFIYRSFFLCVDYLNNLSCRLYALRLIDQRIGDVSHSYTQLEGEQLDAGVGLETHIINHRKVDFRYAVELTAVDDSNALYRVDVGISWQDGPRPMTFTRSAYLLR